MRSQAVVWAGSECCSLTNTVSLPYLPPTIPVREKHKMHGLFIFHLQERVYLSPRPMTSLLQTVSIRINLSRKESGENALIKQLYSCRKAASMSILNYLGTPSRFAFPWHSFTLAHKASSTSYFHLSKEQKRLTAQHHLPRLGASALSEGFCVSLCRNLTPARSRDRKFRFFYNTKDQGKKRPSRNKEGGATASRGVTACHC